MKINHLTSAEENLMKLFWDLDSFYLKDVMEKHAEPKPHQNTVSTYLKILVEKGFLSTQKEGRIFKYNVAVPFAEYKKFLLKQLSQHFFDNSGKEIFQLLLDENLISQEDLKPYFSSETEVKPAKIKEPKHEYAEEVLKIKKKEKDKKKKKNKLK